MATGVVTVTLIISGINQAQSAADVTSEGILIMKCAMMLFPLVAIVVGYFVYLKKYKIDARFHAKIVDELKARGDIA